jgi:hypothetical protein
LQQIDVPFDHLVGAGEQCGRHSESEHPGGRAPQCTRLPRAELGIISAKGSNGMAEPLEITADEQDDRIPARRGSASASRSVSMPGTARVRKAGGGARGLERGLHPRCSALR